MSLDVYLTMPNARIARGGSGIFVRENGQTREITREEWDSKFPGAEPVVADPCGGPESLTDQVFEYNITHNLNRMATEAGIYEHLWRPEEIGITKAKQLIEPLKAGLESLVADPSRFRAFNPKNGLGDYEGLVRFVREYLEACTEHPEADVYASR